MTLSSTTAPAPTVSRHVTLRGLRFHYRDGGNPAGPTVLVLHGLMGHAREWDTFSAALTPTYRVMALNQRGHGESDWADEYSVATMASDVAAFLDETGLGRVHLVGHSMGGQVASVCAAERPDLVDRLVVIDIGPESLDTEFAAMLPAGLEAMAQASYATVDEAVAEWQAGDPLAREDLLRHYVEHCLIARPDGRLVWRFDARGLASYPAGATSAQLWAAVDRIVAPTLVVRGEHSHLLSAAAAAHVVDRLADGTLAEIRGGGHDLGVQQPEAVAAAVSEFLAPPHP